MSTDASAGYRTVGNRLQRVHTLERLPDQRGHVVLVTGGTDGVGRALVDQMAGTGATVLLTARNRTKGAAVRDARRATSGNDDVSVVDLDLASLASVREAAAAILRRVGTARRADLQRRAPSREAADGDGRRIRDDVRREPPRARTAGPAARGASRGERREHHPRRGVAGASPVDRGGLDFDDVVCYEHGDFRPRLACGR